MNIDNINSLSISEFPKYENLNENRKKYLDKNNYNAVPIQQLRGEKIENNSNLCLVVIKNKKL